MGVLSHSSQTDRLNEVPVFQAVVDDTAVKRIVEVTIFCFEVSVTVIVGFFVRCDVTDDHVELRDRVVRNAIK